MGQLHKGELAATGHSMHKLDHSILDWHIGIGGETWDTLTLLVVGLCKVGDLFEFEHVDNTGTHINHIYAID